MIILMDEDGQVDVAEDIEGLNPHCWPTAVKVEIGSDGKLVAMKRSINGEWMEVISE